MPLKCVVCLNLRYHLQHSFCHQPRYRTSSSNERKSKRDGRKKKNISEWGMTGMVDRVFSVERRWLKTEGNPYVWKHGWRKKGKEITIVLLSDFNTRTNKHQSKCKWTKQVRVLHYTHLTTELSATKHCSKELQEFLEGKTTNF